MPSRTGYRFGLDALSVQTASAKSSSNAMQEREGHVGSRGAPSGPTPTISASGQLSVDWRSCRKFDHREAKKLEWWDHDLTISQSLSAHFSGGTGSEASRCSTTPIVAHTEEVDLAEILGFDAHCTSSRKRSLHHRTGQLII